ncbi:MAG TPA: TetR/AcrR family transcriptional regulator [Marmoricola sp.]
MSTSSPRRRTVADRHRAREQEIIAATRALFDAAGTREAHIDDIAAGVGVDRAVIYRHFTGLEELFALTLCSYLDELTARLVPALDAARQEDDYTPGTGITRLVETFVEYGMTYPAFVDCSLSMMRRTGLELVEKVSQSALDRLGVRMARSLSPITGVLQEGVDSGAFRPLDPAVVANHMYASGLGVLQMSHVGVLIRESAPGVPLVAYLKHDQVKEYLVASTLAIVAPER